VSGTGRVLHALDPWILPPVVWGGGALQGSFGKPGAPGDKLGETWEVSCIPGRESRVAGSARTLAGEFDSDPARFLGPNAEAGSIFPLLVKLLATSAYLSVQVHPSDDQARRLEGARCGKHEAWVVLDAGPSSEVVAGLKRGSTASQLFEAAATGDPDRVRDHLASHAVRPGDVIEIPPGCVHAPGPGLVLYEVQQPIDLTYRIFDWGRLGLDGKPRTLHLERARQVLNAAARPLIRRAGSASAASGPLVRTRLVAARSFTLERWAASAASTTPVRQMLAITCIGGDGALRSGDETIALAKGRSCVVAAAAGDVTVDGAGLELLVAVPS
jgi:mannose-6-phosphate isomerase